MIQSCLERLAREIACGQLKLDKVGIVSPWRAIESHGTVINAFLALIVAPVNSALLHQRHTC